MTSRHPETWLRKSGGRLCKRVCEGSGLGEGEGGDVQKVVFTAFI